jgi:hypothetical protein
VIKRVDDPLIELVELTAAGVVKERVAGERMKKPGGKRCVDSFEQFEEHQTEAIALRQSR